MQYQVFPGQVAVVFFLVYNQSLLLLYNDAYELLYDGSSQAPEVVRGFLILSGISRPAGIIKNQKRK